MELGAQAWSCAASPSEGDVLHGVRPAHATRSGPVRVLEAGPAVGTDGADGSTEVQQSPTAIPPWVDSNRPDVTKRDARRCKVGHELMSWEDLAELRGRRPQTA